MVIERQKSIKEPNLIANNFSMKLSIQKLMKTSKTQIYC